MRYFATYLVYIAVIARAIGWNQETSPIPTTLWILLAIFGIFLFSEQTVTRRFPLYPRLYLLIQSVLVITMLYLAPTVDFLAMFLLPLCFQAVQFFPNWIGFTWIGVCILATAGRLLFGLEWEAGLTMVLTGAGIGFLMGSFAYLINRTEQGRQENQRTFTKLQEAYYELKDSAAQTEALAAAMERHRVVRELHDSLTQTLFSMNLAVQSAQLSMVDAPLQVNEHLMRLQNLAKNASSEVQALTGQAPQHPLASGDLATAIQRLANERLVQDDLKVNIEITGKRILPESVESNLYRIVQEALNNVTRHAGVNQALVRLSLESPLSTLEIVDEGCGFDPVSSGQAKGFGLEGMAERAREIGWELEIKSSPGGGTYIHVEEVAK